MTDETISIDHAAVKKNVADINTQVERLRDLRKKIRDAAAEGISATFMVESGKAGTTYPNEVITYRFETELPLLDDAIEKLEDIASTMKQISDSFENLDAYGMITAATHTSATERIFD